LKTRLTTAKQYRVPAAAILAAIAVFAAAAAALTLKLRSELRDMALHREAGALQAVVQMQLDAELDDLDKVELAGSKESAFAAVLGSTRLKGVIAARLFDEAGVLWSSVPATASDAAASNALLNAAGVGAQAGALYYPEASLADSLGTAGLATGVLRAPLLEVAVPVFTTDGPGGRLCVAHFWLDGEALTGEFRSMDRGLWWQAGSAFAIGSSALILVLVWAFRRLAKARDELRLRSEDLARANSELVFSAKNAALGAISAHLIHGLKNPLAGLEGFLSDASESATVGGPGGPALQEAGETTRRIGLLVREVSAVLREEAAETEAVRVPLTDIFDTLKRRVASKLADSGAMLVIEGSTRETISSRVAQLALLVLQNLVENALEATDRGGRVVLAHAGIPSGAVQLDVRDQGCGLSTEVREALFQPLRSTKPGGSGLGLAISAHLARHAGGKLELVDSGPQGSIFRLTLPSYEGQGSSPQ
jgi:signal transduction histidine kinase